MNTQLPDGPDEAFALDAYAALPRSQPPNDVDARILAAAHAANATRRPRRWAGGLATAAVAVLAVGVAWRGLGTREPDYAPAAARPAAPTMQPAFKLETVPAAERQDASKDDEGKAAATRENSAELSSADWQAPATEEAVQSPVPAKPRSAPAPAAPAPEPAVEPDTPIFDEPLPMSELAVPPPPPPAPFAADAVSESRPQEAAKEAPRRSTPPAAAGSPASPPSEVVAGAMTSEPADAATARDAAGSRQEREAPAQEGAAAAAPANTAMPSPFPQDADGRKRAQGLAGVAKSVQQEADAGGDAAAIAASIRDGGTSFDEAVSAARAAHARGDIDAARKLTAAIAAKYGSIKLPADLRRFL